MAQSRTATVETKYRLLFGISLGDILNQMGGNQSAQVSRSEPQSPTASPLRRQLPPSNCKQPAELPNPTHKYSILAPLITMPILDLPIPSPPLRKRPHRPTRTPLPCNRRHPWQPAPGRKTQAPSTRSRQWHRPLLAAATPSQPRPPGACSRTFPAAPR